ncbi:hypothetical protein Hamer_G017551, partial [Homarus americanus]
STDSPCVPLHTMRLRRIRRSDAGLYVQRPTGLVRYCARKLQTVDKSPKLGRCTRQLDECAAENRGLSGAATASSEDDAREEQRTHPHSAAAYGTLTC